MEYLTQHLDIIILTIVTLVLAWDKIKIGGSSLRKEIIADYKERNLQLEAKIKSLEDWRTEMNSKLAAKDATIAEKDRHNDALTKLLQDKNPETLELLREINKSNVALMEFLKIIHNMLETSNKELFHQTSILETGERREQKIDMKSAVKDMGALAKTINEELKSE